MATATKKKASKKAGSKKAGSKKAGSKKGSGTKPAAGQASGSGNNAENVPPVKPPKREKKINTKAQAAGKNGLPCTFEL